MNDIWSELEKNHTASADRRIISLFDESDRMDAFSVETDGLFLDFSKTNMDRKALDLLIQLAQERDVPGKRDAMFRGDRINSTEDRAVLHTSLRADTTEPLLIDGEDVHPGIAQTLRAMETFADGVRSGRIATSEGGTFTDVVNIGIGGSNLGPVMAVRALAPYHTGPRCHFVSNVDSAQISDTLQKLDPRSTLVIITSKTFTTIETMTNAGTAINWLHNALGEKAATHLAAVSTALDKTADMGINPDRVFGFADWVGGRYSLWGPVGLPIMLAIGPSEFRNFLAGARSMDQHFLTTAPYENMPILMALVGIWHRNICHHSTRAVLPYDQRLAKLPVYLQQLDMESNGKRVSTNGTPLERDSGPVVWGEAGTNGQHAFYQLLHQGTEVIPAEFLIAADNHEASLRDHHDLLKANCLAQSEALMLGRPFERAMEISAALGFSGTAQQVQAAHRTFPGNRPSMTLIYPLLTPNSLGQIIALYEHRVFIEGAIWGINSFDQWGVEVGKELANMLLPMIQGTPDEGKDPSTIALVRQLIQ